MAISNRYEVLGTLADLLWNTLKCATLTAKEYTRERPRSRRIVALRETLENTDKYREAGFE